LAAWSAARILDLAGEGRFGDREPVDVARLQQMKTGALLRYGRIAGAILGQSTPSEYQALDDYGLRWRGVSRSPTICSTSRAMPRRSASRRRCRTLARPPSSPSSVSTVPSSASAISGAPIQRYRFSGRRGDTLRAAGFVAERKN
jgi:hypothetical protein